MEAASEEMRFEEAAVAARSADHRGGDGRAAEDGRRQGRRRRYLRLSTPSRRWWRSTCSTCATGRLWTGASSSGKTRTSSTSRSSSPRCCKQILSGPAVHPRRDPRAGGLRGSRSAGGTALREAQSQGGDPHAAARPEEGPAGPGADQRQAQLRRAFPRAEAVVEGHSGGACRMR